MTDAASQTAPLGFVEWFRMGDHAHAETAIAMMRAAGVRRLRTQFSWAEYHMEGAEAWYDWLMPKLGDAFDLMPCFHYTPPSLSRTGRSSGAPHRLRDFADFVDLILTRHGRHFEAVELWNEPNNLLDWDWRADPDHCLYSDMMIDAAHWVRARGFPVVLGGPSPFDPIWLDLMGQRGLLALVDAVGVHGFPGTWDSEAGAWQGWEAQLASARDILDRYNPKAGLWITEAGYSTWAHDEMEQVRQYLAAHDAPADRLYWYAWRDIADEIAVQEGHWFDARHYHMGAVDAANRPKLLARLLTEGGAARARHVAALAAPSLRRTWARPVVITGGCGFIGTNLAESFLAEGEEVLLLDNLCRPGVEQNLEWLRDTYGPRAAVHVADIRHPRCAPAGLEEARAVFHLAAQTAVTTSLAHPSGDFEVNARGTVNLLEAVRATGRRIPVIYASTNKVYGDLEDVALDHLAEGYLPADPALRARGIGEDRPLDFHTPYGCSKGVAEQYVLDYARSYGMQSAVLRMSCIYGPHQFGTEDQGWVAHFLLRALAGAPITLFGDGDQVRDILHVSDAVAAYRATLDRIDAISGRAFNLGGGPENAVSLNRLLAEIGRLQGVAPEITHDRTRTGDQRYFVADTRALTEATGWQPVTGWKDGVASLRDWLARHRLPQTPDIRTRRKVSA
ncbi:NAD-dependent epimerase/dehydratase family protein [Salipiger marinus]|uniref:NAD-dependent epimerase/dehydratase family protein n=1 Tax=Salipiger marinus TaxID=555512 RepID=UPI00405972AE